MERLARLAPLSGAAAALLFAAGNAVWGTDQPARGAKTDEIVSFYTDASDRIVVGATLSIISLIFLVWFGVILRDRLADAEGRRRTGLPALAFAGTIVAAAVGLGAETINMAGALSAHDGQLTGGTAQIYFDVSYALGGPSGGIAIAMIAAPVGLIALHTGRPVGKRWGWLVLSFAVLLVTPVMLTRALFPVFFVALVALAALSVAVYRDD